VSDYTYLIAGGLASAGDEVHVWCPQWAVQPTPEIPGVIVHRRLGRFTSNDLRRAGKMLNQFPAPRRLLVQWVPHGYGYNSLNFQFCLWLWNRAARHRDDIEVMVHEPFLAFGEGSRKQDAVAIGHRFMTMILLRTASRVWTSIPSWEKNLRPYQFRRRVPFSTLPVPSSVPVIDDEFGISKIRHRYAERGFLIGHFGTYGRGVAKLLMAALPVILRQGTDRTVLLLGRGGEQFRDKFVAEYPGLKRVYATGTLSSTDISRHLSACDLMFQPYPDGINGRHTSAMAGLAHGLPTVTTYGHLTESFWFGTDAVAIAPVGDAEANVQLVKRLLEDSTERTRLGNKARALYQEKFDLRHTIDALRSTKRNDRASNANCHRQLEPTQDRRY